MANTLPPSLSAGPLAPEPVADPTPQPKIIAVGTTGITLTALVSAIVVIINIFNPTFTLTVEQLGAIVIVLSALHAVLPTLAGYFTSNR